MMEETGLLKAPDAPALFVRRLGGEGLPVLYVHGATFPSALSVAYRFAGRSWMDDLAIHGFDAWAFDFAGYGGSERPAGMHGAQNGEPIGRAPEAAGQIGRVVEHIMAETGAAQVSIIAHSWGTIPAALLATRAPHRVARLCLFGPVLQRDLPKMETSAEAWHMVTIAQQLARFIEDVPAGHAPVLIEPELAQWGPTYLATDPDSATRTPPAVKYPGGPAVDIAAAWSGTLAYRPQEIRSPTLVVRGAWDHVTSDADVDWLFSRIGSSIRRDAKIPKGTHLMHLEHTREGLFAAVRQFLNEEPA